MTISAMKSVKAMAMLLPRPESDTLCDFILKTMLIMCLVVLISLNLGRQPGHSERIEPLHGQSGPLATQADGAAVALVTEYGEG